MNEHQINNYNLLRLVAACQVLLVHIFHHFNIEGVFVRLLELFPGVPVFFFISGMLIYNSYIRSEHKGLYNFFRKRMLRIYPALIVCFILTVIMLLWSGFLSIDQIITTDFAIWSLAQLSILQFYNPDFLRDFGVGSVNGALWTISVELQFYIITPFLVLIAKRNYLFLIVIAIISLSANFYVHNFMVHESFVSKLLRVSFLPWIYIFIIGVCVARYELLRSFVMSLNSFVLLALYLLSMYFIFEVESNASNGINFVSALLLMSMVYKAGESRAVYSIPHQGLIRKNDFSYGIYIYHMPIINLALYLSWGSLAAIFSILFLTFMMAFSSWYIVEQRMLKLK